MLGEYRGSIQLGHKTQLSDETKYFDFHFEESEGTKKYFIWAAYLFLALTENGYLLADELEAGMHPFLTREIVNLFHNPDSNPHNAQLLFTTHDQQFLHLDRMLPEQIWFCQKRADGSTELYSLADFDLEEIGEQLADVRNDFAALYATGEFGGVPYTTFTPAQFREYIAKKEEETH